MTSMSKIIVGLGVLVLAAVSWGWSAAKPLVLVTTPDMAAIVQPVAGDLVDMEVVLPPGADPHDFTITSAHIRSFRDGALIVYALSQAHAFEAAIKAALPDKPSLDWDDYAAAGASLRDYPGYPRNPHAPWLRLDNARAIARVVARRLEQLGLPAPVLQGRLALFEQELTAQQALAERVVQEHGLAGKPMLAVIPGVCDVIANFGVPVGAVLMAEGSGTVAGKELQDAVARLRAGQYSAIVCPVSMRQTKQGEAARQVARDSGAPVLYVHFLDARPGMDTYLSLAADDVAAVASVGAPHPGAPAASPAHTRRTVTALLAGVAGLLLGIFLGRRLARPQACTRGAGIFDA